VARVDTRIQPEVSTRNVWSDDRGGGQLVVIHYGNNDRTRLSMRPGEALRIAADLVITAASLGSHAAAVAKLTDIVDQLADLQEATQ
jgi:hypothetical protein